MFSPNKINHLDCLKRIIFIVRAIHWLVHSFILQISVTPNTSSLESLHTRVNRPVAPAFSLGPTKRYLVCGQNTKFSGSWTSFVLLFLPLHFSLFFKRCRQCTLEKIREHCEKWMLLQRVLVPQGLQSVRCPPGAGLSVELRMLSSKFSAPQRQLSSLQTPIHFGILNLSSKVKSSPYCLEIDNAFVSPSTFTSHRTHCKIFFSFLLQLKIVPSHKNRDKCSEWEWWSSGGDVVYTSDGELFYVLFTYKIQVLLKTHYSPNATKLLMILD